MILDPMCGEKPTLHSGATGFLWMMSSLWCQASVLARRHISDCVGSQHLSWKGHAWQVRWSFWAKQAPKHWIYIYMCVCVSSSSSWSSSSSRRRHHHHHHLSMWNIDNHCNTMQPQHTHVYFYWMVDKVPRKNVATWNQFNSSISLICFDH